MKKITLLFFMLLFGFLGYSQGLVENFDGATVTVPTTPGPWVLPSGTWRIFDNGVGTLDWTLSSTQTAYPANTQPRAAYINRQNIGAGATSRDYLVSPLITVPANPQLLFNTRTTLAGFQNTVYEVRAALGTSDPADPASYTILLGSWNDDLINTNFDQYEEKSITIPASVGASMYLAFVKVTTQPTAALTGDRWLVDDIRLIEKCQDAAVASLTATALSTSATLTWAAAGASQWQVHVLPATATFDPAVGTPITVTGTPSTVVTATTQPTATPLTPLTSYVYYVRSVCQYSTGTWIGPSTAFTTQAAPPVCGGNFVDAGGTGNYPANSNSTITICPQTPGDLVTVTFTAFSTEATYDALYVFDGNSTSAPQISSTNGAGNVPGALAGGYWGSTIPGPFTSTSANGCLTFNFRSDGSVQQAGWTANVTCGPPPACPKPGTFTVTGVTSTNATLNWAVIAPATSWEVIALPCTAAAPTASTTGTVVTTNTYTFTNLSPSQCYNFYVRANCTASSNGMSDWTSPVSGTTLVAPPVCGGIFTDEGGAGNYPNNANTTWIICPATPGDIVTVTFTAFNTEANWDALYVFNGNSVAAPQIASANGAANVPGGLAGGFWGTTIPGPFESTSADGCLTFRFRSDASGTFAGWTANVTCGPPPACPKPINFTATAPTATSVVLNWTNVTPGTSWQVLALPCGSPAPTATTTGWITANTSTNFVYPGLSSSTCYDFYVRSDCSSSSNGVSLWQGPKSATTLIAPPVCGGVFVDEGGPANYPNNSNVTWTICPTNPGDIVSVVFTAFNTETNWDALYVFNGNSTSAPQIASTNGAGNVPGGLAGGFWGTAIPGPFESSSIDGCLTFNFRSDSSGTFSGWTANVICTPPPTCPKPLALTAAMITQTSATLTWTQPANGQGSVATNWEVLVVPQGSPAPTTSGIPTNGVYVASGLQPATCYSYYVRAICSSTDTSAWAGPFNFCTTPVNDECTNAITVPVNQNLTCAQTTTGTIAGATQSSQASTCAAVPNDDVWYQFTATADTHIISFSNITPATGLTFALYQGTNCGNMTQVSCTAGTSLVASSLIAGQHYYIRVFSTATQPQTSTFTLCVGTLPCAEAPSFCSSQPVTYQNATNVPSLGTIGCLVTTPNPAFFFLQVNQAGPLNYLLTQSTTPGGGPNLDVDYVVWGPFPDNATACASIPTNPLPQGGACPALHACSYSAAATETMCLPNAQLCEVYVVMITNFANQAGYVTFTQTNSTSTGGGQTECYPDNTFNYSQVAYCQNAPNPTPVLATGAVSGGVYTSTPGLVIDPATGTINLAASVPGTYIVTSTYSITGTVTCANFQNVIRTRTVIITPVPNATIAYTTPATYCVNSPVQNVTVTGTAGGSYSASPSGLFIDSLSGTIVPSASTPGVYTVTYTVAASGGCSAFTTTTTVEILTSPNVTAPASATYCDQYLLPALSNGAYYGQTGGQGAPIAAGTAITTTQTIYVYQSNGVCSDEESFTVTIDTTPDLSGVQTSVGGCSSYVVPTPAIGHYYDAQNGAGNILDGTTLTADTTMYLYASNGTCSAEVTVTVTVGSIVADTLPDVVSCGCYTLPVLSPNNNYYTGSGGTGTLLTAGTCVNASQTIYIYATGTGCAPVETDFVVTITTAPDLSGVQTSVGGCNSFVVPTPAQGHYYDAQNGTGNILDGTTLTSDTMIYLYAGSGACSSEVAVTVTIGSIVADTLPDAVSCGCFTLPALSANNSYYTGSGGTGTMLTAGTCVNSTQTIYIYATGSGCTPSETEFLVTIYQQPTVSPIQNVSACGSYTLPVLASGGYFSQSGGVDPITATTLGVGSQTVYVYVAPAAGSPCVAAETSFTVSVTSAPVADTFADATLCQGQGFTLPTPSAGNAFYTQSGGSGTQLAPGSQLTQSTQVFVYAAPSAGSSCPGSESSFTVGFTASPESAIAGGCQGNAYVLTATPVNYDGATASYSWTSSDGQVVSGGSTPSVTVSGAGTYTLTVTVTGCDGSTPFVAGSTSCTIQKGISANNDGLNDFFDLDGFNVSRLEIFNRYGTKVYERRNYVNEWKGQSDKGDELPDGTYYYVIERRDGEPTKTGWIYINRKN